MIRGKRIRKLSRYLGEDRKGTEVVCSALVSLELASKLQEAGFSESPQLGDKVLPTPVGPVSLFNAEGRLRKLRDKAKIQISYEVDTRWSELHGSERRTRYGRKVVNYYKFPTEIDPPPPGVLLTISEDPDKNRMICAPAVIYQPDSERLMHTANLMLELFGICEFSDSSLNTVGPAATRVSWEILPRGHWDVDHLKLSVIPRYGVPKRQQQLAEANLRFLLEHSPGAIAVGEAGFSGYAVYVYDHSNLCLCENSRYGNATYVLPDNDWQSLTRLSKSELLKKLGEESRIIHDSNWRSRVDQRFKSPAHWQLLPADAQK